MKLKDGMSDKLAVVANLLGTSVICIGIAFPLGWELALACISVMPFSIAAAVALSNVSLFTLLDGTPCTESIV